MKRFKTLLLFFIVFSLFTVTGCKDLLTQHNIDQKGVQHGKKLYKGVKNCTACHGINLNGNGPIPSCYACHEAIWSKDDHTRVKSGASDPTANRSGVKHKPSLNFSGDCVNCHGADLKGSGRRPSCYACHNYDNWSELQARHPVNIKGRYHGTGRTDPDRFCAGCHGTGLSGANNAPSCYGCHYAKWLDTSDHTALKYGVGHKAAPASDCAQCHGPDLKGTQKAPSCYLCHGAKWLGGD